MPSTKESFRRAPQQQRAGQRIEQLLEAAASVMAEVGYEAATMTTIAERAGTSIGTVYVYFPDKQAIVRALNNRYGEAIEEAFAKVEEDAESLGAQELAHRFVDMTTAFVADHPAYFTLADAPINTRRDLRARERLRSRIAAVLRSKQRELSEEASYSVAEVCVQIIKSMNPLYASASASVRRTLVSEYKLALGAYMKERLHGAVENDV